MESSSATAVPLDVKSDLVNLLHQSNDEGLGTLASLENRKGIVN